MNVGEWVDSMSAFDKEVVNLQKFFDYQRLKNNLTADKFTRRKCNYFEAFNFTDSIHFDVYGREYTWGMYRFYPQFMDAIKKNSDIAEHSGEFVTNDYYSYLNFRDKIGYIGLKRPNHVMTPLMHRLLEIHSAQRIFLEFMNAGYGVSDAFTRFVYKVLSGQYKQKVSLHNTSSDNIDQFKFCINGTECEFIVEEFLIADRVLPDGADDCVNIDDRFEDKEDYYLSVKRESNGKFLRVTFEGTMEKYETIMNEIASEMRFKGVVTY